MKIAPVLTDLIGNTPLLALDRYAPGDIPWFSWFKMYHKNRRMKHEKARLSAPHRGIHSFKSVTSSVVIGLITILSVSIVGLL